MSWKRRILELALAGGVLSTTSGCGNLFHPPACNANPDPCCLDATSQACIDYNHRDLSVIVAADLAARDLGSHD